MRILRTAVHTRDSPRMPRSCDAARSPSHDAARSYIQIGDYCFSITIISVVTPSSLLCLSASPSLIHSFSLRRLTEPFCCSFALTYVLTYARDYGAEAGRSCKSRWTSHILSRRAYTLVNPPSPFPGRRISSRASFPYNRHKKLHPPCR